MMVVFGEMFTLGTSTLWRNSWRRFYFSQLPEASLSIKDNESQGRPLSLEIREHKKRQSQGDQSESLTERNDARVSFTCR